MSTLTAPRTVTTPSPTPSAAGPGLLSATGILRSEWIKLRSLRSTWWSLLIGVVAMVGLGAIFSSFTRTGGNGGRAAQAVDPISTSLGGYNLAQLAIGVLGVLAVTGEYSSGTIRSSIAAVPRRVPVLLAKAAVLAVTVFVPMVAASFGSFFLGQWLLSRHGASTTIGAPGVLRVVVGVALYLTAIGLLGMALGWLLRQGAAALATLFGVLLVLPILGLLLPASWSDKITPYLPGNLGQDLLATHPGSGVSAPWTGFALLCGYLVVLGTAGALLLRRRDV